MPEPSNDVTITTALMSVSDKEGLADFAAALMSFDVQVISTGGTHRLLAEAGVNVREVADHTGFPEMMDGRVKTLHPKIHGGLLGRRGVDDEVMAQAGIEPLDLVVVNLYPFAAAVSDPDCTLENAIENIDIGGPAMLRSAAKNFRFVTVVVDPADYAPLVSELNESGGFVSAETRFRLACKAFAHVSAYDAAISNYLGSLESWFEPNRTRYPLTLTRQWSRQQTMRYGENPHQSAAFYVETNAPGGSIASATQRQGKEISFNNVADTDAALACASSFEQPACVIVKHANPCGVAIADSTLEAYNLAFETDPTSAFGGIIAFNRAVDTELAEAITDRQFVEVIIAPSVTDDALKVLARKKNVRVFESGELVAPAGMDIRTVGGGLLVQERDTRLLSEAGLQLVTERAPTDSEHRDLLFAFTVAKYVKSNAIVYARDSRTIGVGAGQMARVYSAKIAGIKAADAGLTVAGSVMASDAFFPFRDSIDAAAEEGITAVIQPGGSIRDDEVIAAANEAGMAMVFTGMRHFRH